MGAALKRAGCGLGGWGAILSFSFCASVFALSCISAARAQETTELPSAPQPNSPTGQNSPQQDSTQQNRAPDKDENPAEKVTHEATAATEKVAEDALYKARDWESGWITGVFIKKGDPITPLEPQQRWELYLQQTYETPGAYLKRLFLASLDQARGSPSAWSGGIGGYAARFASREGQFFAANSLAALGDAKLHYEPRYDQCKCAGMRHRVSHAILRNFLTYNESGQYRPQWALYAGAFGGGMISTAWRPPHKPVDEGMYAVIGQAGYGAALNLFIEFAGDINRKIGGNGKVGTASIGGPKMGD
jgi:hypothetical protein